MKASCEVSPDDFFAGRPVARAVFEEVCVILARLGPFEVRITKSQASFRRRRAFAYLWMPGQYLTKPNAEVVLSIALGRYDPSKRFKEVAHPVPRHWLHHLEIDTLRDLDDEVVSWLQEAAERAT